MKGTTEEHLDANRVRVLILDGRGEIAEEHEMLAWDVEREAGILAGKFRDAHGYSPNLDVRYPDGRDGHFLLPRSWR